MTYSWHNWLSNGSLISHFTERLFLHYREKAEQYQNMHLNEKQQYILSF